jgi:phosphopantetheine adenylyltransferase
VSFPISAIAFRRYLDFFDAGLVAAAFERSREKLFKNIEGKSLANQATAHYQNVGIIMLARQRCFERIVAQYRANAGVAVGGNRDADA